MTTDDYAHLAIVRRVIADKGSTYRIRAELALTRDELWITGISDVVPGATIDDVHWHYSTRCIQGVDYTPEYANVMVDAVIMHLDQLSIDCQYQLCGWTERNDISRESTGQPAQQVYQPTTTEGSNTHEHS